MDWGTPIEAMEAALELEKTVNQSLLDLHKVPGDNKNKFNSEGECRHACGWTPGSHVPKEAKGNDYWFDKVTKTDWDDEVVTSKPKPNPKSKFIPPRPSIKPKPKGQLGYEHYMMW